MRRSAILAFAVVAGLLVTGCGVKRAVQKAKQAGEAARVVRDIQDGDKELELRGEDGTVKIDGDEGTMVFEGKDGETVRVETDEDTGVTTVTSDDGRLTLGQDEAAATTSEEIGVDLYPGAEAVFSLEEGEGGATIMLKTDAPFDKVAKFYKTRYGSGGAQVNEMTAGDVRVLSIVTEIDGDQTTITVTTGAGGDGVNISIARAAT